MASPALAMLASSPRRSRPQDDLTEKERKMLRQTALKTWRFFRMFVNAQENHLPPDNFQEDPKPVIAHRTSPTNMGLCLLSVCTARDLGWLGLGDTAKRLEDTLASMGKLERYRGHFFNWYDTKDMRILEPRYISTVDSGNLAGHLLALKRTCHDFMASEILSLSLDQGLKDLVDLVKESAQALPDNLRVQAFGRTHMLEALEALESQLLPIPADAGEWATRVPEWEARADAVVDVARSLAMEQEDDAFSELLARAEFLRASLSGVMRDIQTFFPWANAGVLSGSPLRPASSRDGPPPAWTHHPEGSGRALSGRRGGTARPARPGTVGRAVARLVARRRAGSRLRFREGGPASPIHVGSSGAHRFHRGTHGSGHGLLLPGGSRNASSSPSVSAFARNSSIPASTICWLPRCGSPVSWQSPKGDVPPSHWFRLGRTLTPVGKGATLLSWSGSMFEYLMPLLVMRSPLGSLLDVACRFAVQRQIEYGNDMGTPWGISEAAYNIRDLEMTYQYSSFGVPGLGLKRGLSGDLVIAPYATGLAALVAPREAAENLARLRAEGAEGRYGFYEAIDYTKVRLQEGARATIVKSYFAHHQGMMLVALGNVLLGGRMQERFHSEPIIRAVDPLLQERIPRGVAVTKPHADEVARPIHVDTLVEPVLHRFSTPHEPIPRTHVLSNGRYTVLMTSAGSGFSRWQGMAVTRWREDAVLDAYGQYIYLRDPESGETWSAGYQPVGVEPDFYEAMFAEDRVEITRRDGTLSSTLEVVISPEDDAEVRRVTLHNRGNRDREIEVTSYCEVVMAPHESDVAHPAFSNLFVQTEFHPNLSALLATRRSRSSSETPALGRPRLRR